MDQLLHTFSSFNHWSQSLPIYLQVFLGMMAFFLASAAAGFLIYGLLLILQRLSHFRPLSSLTGVIGFSLTLSLGWFMYIFIPLAIIALSNHENLNMAVLTQTMGPYFGVFLLISLSFADTLESKGLWANKNLTAPAKLFSTSLWVLAFGVPAIKKLHQLKRQK